MVQLDVGERHVQLGGDVVGIGGDRPGEGLVRRLRVLAQQRQQALQVLEQSALRVARRVGETGHRGGNDAFGFGVFAGGVLLR